MLRFDKLYLYHLSLVLSVSLSLLSATVKASSAVDTLISRIQALSLNDAELVILYPEGALTNLQPIAEAFTESTGIAVSFISSSVDDINTLMLLSGALEHSDYDIALPATFGIPDLVEAKAVLDISHYAQQYEPLVNYTPSLYPLGDVYKGKQYGYQTDGDAYVMFYNQAWLLDPVEQSAFLKQYHRPLSLPKSWAELDELMAFFTRAEEKKYGGCLFRTPRYMMWEWWIRFHAHNVYPVDDQMRPNIAKAEGVAALQAMLDATPYQHPSVRVNGLVDNWKEYAKGHCFANIGWGGTQKYLNSDKSSMRDNLIHAPTPERSYFNWGWNYVVSPYSKQPELAYLFTLFASLPEISILAIREDGFFDPYRPEHYNDKTIENRYTPSFLKAHKSAMKQAIPDFYLEGQGRYTQALEHAIVSAFEGYVTPQEALDYAAKEWERITQSIGRQNQIDQWLLLKQHYPKHPASP